MLLVDYVLNCLLLLDIPYWDLCKLFYKLHFLGMGFSLAYKRNSVEFSVDFRELGYFKNLLLNSLGVKILVFQMGCDILMPYGFLIGFQETRTYSRTYGSCYMSTLRVEA